MQQTTPSRGPLSGVGAALHHQLNRGRPQNRRLADLLSRAGIAVHAQPAATFTPGPAVGQPIAYSPQGMAAADSVLKMDEGMNALVRADATLTRVERLFSRMRELIELAEDKSISPSRREELMEELDALLDELDELSDSGLLDGVFGGIPGLDGLLALGIESISSDGRLEGRARLQIRNENGRFTMTLRINGETITGNVERGSGETVFTLRSGQTVTVRHGQGLRSGTVANIGFYADRNAAFLHQAVSAADSARPRWMSGAGGKTVAFPDLFDVSAVGMGLHGLSLRSPLDAARAAEKLEAAILRVSKLRETIAQTMKDALTPSAMPPRTGGSAAADAPFMTPAQLIQAQTIAAMVEAALQTPEHLHPSEDD